LRLLAKDSRSPYNNVASAVGITPSATKKRVNKMVSNGVINKFVTLLNPAIFTMKNYAFKKLGNTNKTIKEQDLFKRIRLFRRHFYFC
jgi:DNA-binding Lrp family transcriptional regulator